MKIAARSDFPDGVIAAALTPMKSDLSVDYERMAAHCRWLFDQGCDGITLLGTTGEANSLASGERMKLLDAVIDAGLPPHRLMVGTGCCSFPETLELTRHALSHRVGGVLIMPPFYYKNVSDEGLFASYANIIERTSDDSLRIFLYHFPKMSGVPISHALIERLLDHFPTVVAGIKDSSRDWENSRSMIERFPEFRVFAGTEQFLLDIVRTGGAGCISATANVTAALASRIYTAHQTDKVDILQDHLTEIRIALQAYSFVPALKALIARQNKDEGWNIMRPPHLPLGASTRATLEEQMTAFNTQTASISAAALFA